MNCKPDDLKKNRPITINLTKGEYKFIQEKLPDVKISRYIKRMLLERLGYEMPQPQN